MNSVHESSDTMPNKRRREQEKSEMRELILTAASEIIAVEGFDKLSIRKIGNKIEYSPSIIYNYFEDKDAIVNNLMQRAYQKIVSAISSINTNIDSPEDKLKEMTKKYIEEVLKMPYEFMSAQLNKSPQAIKHTSSLYKGASKSNIALSFLFDCLKEINKDMDDSKVELTSQIIVASTLGFVIKLIIEKDIGDEQRKSLTDYFCNEVIIRMAKGE